MWLAIEFEILVRDVGEMRKIRRRLRIVSMMMQQKGGIGEVFSIISYPYWKKVRFLISRKFLRIHAIISYD